MSWITATTIDNWEVGTTSTEDVTIQVDPLVVDLVVFDVEVISIGIGDHWDLGTTSGDNWEVGTTSTEDGTIQVNLLSIINETLDVEVISIGIGDHWDLGTTSGDNWEVGTTSTEDGTIQVDLLSIINETLDVSLGQDPILIDQGSIINNPFDIIIFEAARVDIDTTAVVLDVQDVDIFEDHIANIESLNIYSNFFELVVFEESTASVEISEVTITPNLVNIQANETLFIELATNEIAFHVVEVIENTELLVELSLVNTIVNDIIINESVTMTQESPMNIYSDVHDIVISEDYVIHVDSVSVLSDFNTVSIRKIIDVEPTEINIITQDVFIYQDDNIGVDLLETTVTMKPIRIDRNVQYKRIHIKGRHNMRGLWKKIRTTQ